MKRSRWSFFGVTHGDQSSHGKGPWSGDLHHIEGHAFYPKAKGVAGQIALGREHHGSGRLRVEGPLEDLRIRLAGNDGEGCLGTVRVDTQSVPTVDLGNGEFSVEGVLDRIDETEVGCSR